MRAFRGRGAKGLVVRSCGSALLLRGCSQSMMAEKKMIDKDMPKESMPKDDTMTKDVVGIFVDTEGRPGGDH